MTKNDKTKNILMLIGGLLMIICSFSIIITSLYFGVTETTAIVYKVIPWLFLVGALMFTVCQRLLAIPSTNFTLNRLFSIQLLSGCLFVVSGLLLVENFNGIINQWLVNDINSYILYYQIVHNNWVVFLIIGSFLQIYTTYRISFELKKN